MAARGGGPRRGPASVRGQLQLLLAAMVVAISVNLVAAGLLGLALDRGIEQRLAADRVDRHVRALVEAVVLAEQSVQGYVITGDPRYTASYEQARGDMAGEVGALRREVAGDPKAQQMMDRLEALVGVWGERSAQVVEAVGRDDASARRLFTDAAAQRLFTDVRGAVGDLATVVDDRSTHTLQEAGSGWWRYFTLLVVTLAATAALAAVATRVLRGSLAQPLDRLVADASRVAGGDLQHPVSAQGPIELAAVGRAVEGMRTRLLKERSVAARRSLLAGQEDERRRLAMGIHDDSVQAVLAASLRLQRLRRHLRDADPEGTALVHEVQADLEEAIARLRRMIFELHPPTLDREGLEAAVRLYLAETLDPAGVSWGVEVRGEPPADPVTGALVYRLIREAVLNVLRHAEATSVRVTLVADGGDVRVTVEDDGVGFDTVAHATPVPGHLGMLASRQLCEATGGHWEVDSAPGRGTRVRFAVPAALA